MKEKGNTMKGKGNARIESNGNVCKKRKEGRMEEKGEIKKLKWKKGDEIK